ncbi:MAG: tail fiber domain-containing protein, partial [Dolichospermum sp.]
QEHKQDITKLSNEDLNSILERLKQTPVFRYRFKTPGIDGKIRLGVIAEQSPEDILDESGKAVSFLDYNGFLLAALKAQQSLIENLQNDILLLQKR